MLAVNLSEMGPSSRKRDPHSVYMEEDEVESHEASHLTMKRRRRLSEDAIPNTTNRMLHLQHDNEIRELRFNLEKKDRELRDKVNQIQQMQNQLSASSSKTQQFDSIAKVVMEQSNRLKLKEEEISSLTNVVQQLLAENRSLKNQLFIVDRQSMSNFIGN